MKFVVLLYKVLIKDIFLTNAAIHVRKPLFTPWSCVKYVLRSMDGIFGASKSHPPFTPIIMFGRARIFFFLNNSDCDCEITHSTPKNHISNYWRK